MDVPTAPKLATLAFQQFKLLPKTGKPSASEWTIFSSILLHSAAEEKTEVISIGCGTKCIGKSKLCSHGFILNDSHAEVLARRALLRYIYYQLKQALVSDLCIFQWDSENLVFRLRPGLSFHFVSTQTPCGDACIHQNTSVNSSTHHNHENTDGPTATKRAKIENNISSETAKSADNVGSVLDASADNAIYTGAKLIGLDDQQDAMLQKIGAVRTKPGRGDRTLSMSCSDKLARWNLLGAQGALLDSLLAEPIYFKSLNFCGNPHNEPAIRRAIYERFIDRHFTSCKYKIQKPEIRFVPGITFDYAEDNDRRNPSPTGLCWCNIDEHLKPYEISVNGKRQGVTKKRMNTPQAALKIAKYHLMNEFVELLRLEPKLAEKFQINQNQLSEMKYNQFKQLANDYQSTWALAKQIYFQQWTQKPPSLLAFCLTAVET
ncbi:tRNA-specific adenosine deaminase 1 [Anastrepha obliqua]|uniref:tRNA-specific adenosine deaminase 1 n=1 Tax=Anastrepha obliqua TaxID=95512 RepID=UPI002409C3D2|nr:tRNA-specific adenosine deaminase 1 [Anastrepha obliqua]